MKWLIIYSNKSEAENVSSAIKNSFSKSEVTLCSFVRSELEESFAASQFSHVVILSSGKSLDSYFYFVFGILLGSGSVVYTTEQNFVSLALDFSFDDGESFQYFDDSSSLIKFVSEKKEEILFEYEKNESFSYLMEHGYPFTEDTLSSLIESPKWKKSLCARYIQAGMSVNARNSDGTPLLNVACRADNFAAVKWLCSLGADVHALSKDRGYSAVMDAVWRGNEEITEYLIKQGSPLNTISKEGQTMLVLAVGADKVNICRLLAENGADPDIQDAMGMSAYGYASLFKKQEILSILEKYHKA